MSKLRLRVDEIIYERRMTQEAFARLVGLSRVSVNKLANNPRQIKINTLGKISDALGIPIEQLFTRQESQ